MPPPMHIGISADPSVDCNLSEIPLILQDRSAFMGIDPTSVFSLKIEMSAPESMRKVLLLAPGVITGNST